MFRSTARKFMRGMVLTGMFTLAHASQSSATSLAANTSYNIQGQVGFLAAGQNGAPDYFFRGTVASGATLSIGDLTGNSFNSISSSGDVTFEIFSYAAGAIGSKVGTGTGSLETSFSNISVNIAHNVAAGLANEVSGGGLLLNVDGSINGELFNFAAGLAPKFTQEALGGSYDNIVTHLGQDFAVALGDIGAGTDIFFTWFMGSTVLFASNYTIQGDLGTTFSEVPEPTTLGLLGMGLLGSAMHRRKPAKQAETAGEKTTIGD